MLYRKELYFTFEKVFREHYNALASYALTILRNRQDAEDVVQEVFIRVWQKSPEVIETAHLKFYLLTAVKNGCISFLRKQAGKNFLQPEEVSLHEKPEEENHQPENRMLMAEKAIATLPPQCQVIFKMSRFGQLTYQQIADELEISIKTVENQVGKALKLMRDYARKHDVCLVLILGLLGSGLS
jgi:RNA polymerase sigma-70 factor (ECF subfamily)